MGVGAVEGHNADTVHLVSDCEGLGHFSFLSYADSHTNLTSSS